MKLHLKYDMKRIKVGDWLAAETGSVGATRNVLACCMTDDKDQFLPIEEATAILDALTLDELNEAGMQLIKVMQTSAVNPQSAASS